MAKTPRTNSKESSDAAFLKPKEAERMARGPVAVGAVSGKVTRPLLGTRGLAEGDLIARWADIVGPAVACAAVPERLRFAKGKREGGELLVRVASGPFALQLQHDAPMVLARINGFFGYPAVAKLKLVQAPLPLRSRPEPPTLRPLAPEEERALTAQVADVEDPDLRAALERLGRAMAGRSEGAQQTSRKGR